MNVSLSVSKTRLLLIPILALIGLFGLANRVEASDEVIKAEMYLGDYEISKEKTSSGNYINKEVKYIETGSGKVIKERVSTTNTWNTKYYHTNHQGSTSVVTDNQGQKDTEFSTGRLRYFPYGEQITRQDVVNLVVDDTYTGQKRDTETDLMFYNARLYNQKTGLFMQADRVNDGLNRYMYVGGNPVTEIDPTGNVRIEDDNRLGPEDRAELLANRKKAEEARKKRQAYVDKGVWAFANAFATWYGGDQNSKNPCEWTVGCNDDNFTGSQIAERVFELSEEMDNGLIRSIINRKANQNLNLLQDWEKYLYTIGEHGYIFSPIDVDRLNDSAITDINIASFISILVTESARELRDFSTSSLYNHIGKNAISATDFYDESGNWQFSTSVSIITNVSALIYSLRIYQGTYNGGGNFSALSDDRSNLNSNVFQYYNANPIWYPRANQIYNYLYNFASQNEEYSWLIENLVD